MRKSCTLALLVLLFGCRTAPLPDLPEIDAKHFPGPVGSAVQEALLQAKARPKDAEAVERLGMVLQAHDQYKGAVACYRRASGLDASRFSPLYYLGMALAADGDYAGAARALGSALRLKPDYEPARLKLAEVLLQSGETAESERMSREIVTSHPNDPTAHYLLGRVLDGQEAAAEFRKALDLFPRYGAAQFALASAYRKSGDAANAESVLRTYEKDKLVVPPVEDPLMAAVADLNSGATGLLRKGRQLEAEGRLKEAVALHLEAIGVDPKLAQAHVNLISLYGRLAEVEKAEQSFRKAVELEPDRGDAYYNFGVLCFERERLEEARKAFERAVELDPNHPEALHNLGSLVERDGQWDRAAELYRRAISLKPDYRLAHFRLGRIYANQKKYSDAIQQFERTLEPVDDNTPVYLYALGATYGRSGNRSRAVEMMRQARSHAAALGLTKLVSSIDRDLQSLGAQP